MQVKSESEVTLSDSQTQCLTPSDSMDCSLPGSSIHGIFQARVLEWVAIAFSALSIIYSSIQFSSVAQSCLTLGDPVDCSTPGLPVHINSWSLRKFMSIESVMPFNHLILCCPLLLLPSIFLSIRVFSNESVLCIRWPKYWSFSFSVSPFSEYSGLTSFRIDWFVL